MERLRGWTAVSYICRWTEAKSWQRKTERVSGGGVTDYRTNRRGGNTHQHTHTHTETRPHLGCSLTSTFFLSVCFAICFSSSTCRHAIICCPWFDNRDGRRCVGVEQVVHFGVTRSLCSCWKRMSGCGIRWAIFMVADETSLLFVKAVTDFYVCFMYIYIWISI